MNNPQEYFSLLRLNGFTRANHVKDFGDWLAGIYYAEKQTGDLWQYVQVIFDYDDQFCEAVYELYVAQKNTRCKSTNTLDAMKRGGQNISATLVRDLDTLRALVSRNETELQNSVNETLNYLTKKSKK